MARAGDVDEGGGVEVLEDLEADFGGEVANKVDVEAGVQGLDDLCDGRGGQGVEDGGGELCRGSARSRKRHFQHVLFLVGRGICGSWVASQSGISATGAFWAAAFGFRGSSE